MKKSIVFISSNFLSIKSFLDKAIIKLSKSQKIIIYTNLANQDRSSYESNVEIVLKHLPIVRNVNILNDLKCLILITYYLLKNKPDSVITLTPKAGLLGMLASFIARIRIRIHYFTGQVWVTRTGIERSFLKFIDHIINKLSTDCLTDSKLQKKFLEDQNVVSKDYLKVLANGSICGVDTKKFYRNESFRQEIRGKLKISEDTILLLFLGRLNKDKGILDLAEVVNDIIENQKKNISLLIVGPDEENIKSKIKQMCKNTIKRIHFVDFTDQPEKYMSSADLFCLPSYREGFGMAALEAGACALPVVTSRIYGLVDAVKENHTGLFHEVKNKRQMKDSIIKLVDDKKLREKLGRQGRERVLKEFEQAYVTDEFVGYVEKVINIKKYISIVSSNQLSIELFLKKQIIKLAKYNHINIFTDVKYNEFTKLINEKHTNIKLNHINIKRRVSIISDIFSFISLNRLLLLSTTDIIFTITPKGGFIGILSGFVQRVNKRIHWYGGQVWFNRRGFVRQILKFIDKLISKFSTNVLTECKSQKKFLEDQNVVSKDYLKVLANGSICGVDTKKFYRNESFRQEIRGKLKISEDTILLLFLGRLNKDKGILDLAEVVNDIIENQKKNISLLIVGPDEENIKSKIKQMCKNTIKRIHFVDFTDQPEKYMSSADLFCLPSYREGFGMAALEAGACALPVVTSRIYGLVDAVKENHTGLFHEVKNKRQMKDSIIKLVDDKKLREKLGRQGRERVLKEFEQDYVTDEFVGYVENL